MAVILVSQCLLGCVCRYDGKTNTNDAVISLAKDNVLVGVCPEQMGGLTTPRPPAEIRGDRVFSIEGADVTAQYKQGAENALRLARLNKVSFAIMKANSPSCGVGTVYDGSFSGTKCAGNGVAVQLLIDNGIAVYSEKELDKLPL